MNDSSSNLTKTLSQELNRVLTSEELDDAGRMHLSAMLEQVQRKIESPNKFLQNLTQGSSGLVAARIAIAMGIFDAFAACSKAEMTLEELKPRTKGDIGLLTRIMRLLASRGLAELTVSRKWRLTPIGRSMTTGSIPAMMVIHFYYNLRSHGSLLEFLEKTDFQNPNDSTNGPWQYGYNVDQHYFEWMQSGDPLRYDSFNTVMKINQSFRGQDWYDFYPVEEKLKAKSGETLLVDIGGGLGHDAIAFRDKFFSLPGKVVLQDLPRVISQIDEPLPPGLEARAYDAFTSQPIQGAKAYYLRTVLHDFPDVPARQILENVRHAMDENSVLLLNENLMPEDHISPIAVDIDFIMMNILTSLERTEEQWLQLLDRAGFKVLQVWRPTQGQVSANALFEAVPK